MRRFHWLALMGVTAFVLAACNNAAAPPPASATASGGPENIATIKDIMDAVVDPAADVL